MEGSGEGAKRGMTIRTIDDTRIIDYLMMAIMTVGCILFVMIGITTMKLAFGFAADYSPYSEIDWQLFQLQTGFYDMEINHYMQEVKRMLMQ